MVKRIFCTILAAALASCSGAPKVAKVGLPAPQWTQVTAQGRAISMQSLAGKPVYLNFFATWCPPCNVEAPDVNALQKKYAAQGLQVVGVDELENAQKARSFARKYGLVYPAIADDGALGAAYLVNGLPVHVFISRDGIVREIKVGEMSKAQIERSIRALL